jgi:hypothetical protein
MRIVFGPDWDKCADAYARWEKRERAKDEWHRVFLWFPRILKGSTIDGRNVFLWLCYAERKRYYKSLFLPIHDEYRYREITSEGA